MATYSLVVIFFLPVISRAQYYHISEERSFNADSLCDLGTPDINFLGQQVSLDTHIGLQDGQQVWVGYAKIYKTFLYKGCADIAKLTFSKSATLPRDPGICYSFCGGSDILFGLQDDTCYCIDKIFRYDESLKEQKCHVKCHGMLCGNETILVSVYEEVEVKTELANAEEDGECLSFDGNDKEFQWSHCTEENKKLICRDEYSNNEENTYNTWAAIMVRCIQRGERPVGPNHWDSYGRYNSDLWTGVVRRLSILPITDVSTSDSGFKQGYIEYTNNEFKLNFVTEPTRQMKALCLTETPLSSSRSHETTTTKNQNTTQKRSQDNTSNMTPDDDGSSSTYAVAVGIAVPAAIVIIVVVVICIWRKRKESKDKHPLKSSTIHGGGRVNEGMDLNNVGGQDRSTIQSSHNYDPVYSGTLNTNEYGYDTAGAVGISEAPNNATNEYNRLDLNSTYNHVGEKTGPGQINETGNVYNISEKEMTYNKLNEKQEVQTDNVYNKTEPTEDYDTATSRQQVQPTTDNVYNTADAGYTYSKVSRDPAGGIVVTDNVYDRTREDGVGYNTIDRGLKEYKTENNYTSVTDDVLYCVPPD